MGGVKMGDDFVSAKVAKEGVIDFIRQTVGPRENPRTGKPMKPDLIFAVDVIKRTIPVNVLKGAKQTISLNKERIKLIIELHGEKNSILVKKMFSEDFHLFYEMLDDHHVFAYFR